MQVCEIKRPQDFSSSECFLFAISEDIWILMNIGKLDRYITFLKILIAFVLANKICVIAQFNASSGKSCKDMICKTWVKVQTRASARFSQAKIVNVYLFVVSLCVCMSVCVFKPELWLSLAMNESWMGHKGNCVSTVTDTLSQFKKVSQFVQNTSQAKIYLSRFCSSSQLCTQMPMPSVSHHMVWQRGLWWMRPSMWTSGRGQWRRWRGWRGGAPGPAWSTPPAGTTLSPCWGA